MVPTPEELTDPFVAGIIPYGVDLQKIFPPPATPTEGGHRILIKVYVLLRLGLEGDRRHFEALRQAIVARRTFCGIFVHEASDMLIDDLGGYVELVCYLRRGNEEALLRLDEVARASLRLAGSFQSRGDDAAAVRALVDAVRAGRSLEQAVAEMPSGPRARPAPVGAASAGRSPPPTPTTGAPEGLEEGYIIGSKTAGRVVVVHGAVGKRLKEAHDRTVREE